MGAATDRNLLRIGELSRRMGVSEHLPRAWESRYGLLQPVRSRGGFRLYSEADKSRIRTAQAYLTDGLSAAEAAALRQALDAFDEPAAQAEQAGWPR
jgi:MerR family transcriptional regulator, light-induced transcriptional regulator